MPDNPVPAGAVPAQAVPRRTKPIARRVAALVCSALLSIGLLGATLAPVQAVTTLTTFPAPGTSSANPATQLTFRGSGSPPTIDVHGSTSGRHAGSWLAHSDGNGSSFVPATPFTAGEQVTVRTNTRIEGGDGDGYAFTVATPANAQAARSAAARPPSTAMDGPDPLGTARPGVRSVTGLTAASSPVTANSAIVAGPSTSPTFLSRPDLQPPTVTTTGTSTGLNLALPQMGSPTTQRGPMIYDATGRLVYFDPAPAAMSIANLTRVNYLGTDALAWFEGVAIYPGAWAGDWKIVDSTYREIARIGGANGIEADVHELLVTDRGSAVIVAYPFITVDLSPYGGNDNTTLLDAVVQEIDLNTGAVLFEWHGWDHINPRETYLDLTASTIDYLHINSVDINARGDFLISCRNSSSVYLLDHRNGKVIWKLGGKDSDFTFAPGEAGPSFQHDARFRPNGVVSIFDNGVLRNPQFSRGVAWKLDTTTFTATTVTDQRHSPSFYSDIVGSFRSLPNGNTLLSWGRPSAAATEYDPAGRQVWESRLQPGEMTYRTYRVDGWRGRPAAPPALAVTRSQGAVSAFASWNGSTELATWQLLAGPDADTLRVVASATASGFETKLDAVVSSSDDTFVVRARGAGDTVLRASDPVTVGYAQASAVLPVRQPDGSLGVANLVGDTWQRPAGYGGLLGTHPGATVLTDGRILTAVKGQPDRLYVKFSGETGLSPWYNLGGELSSRPSVTPLPGGQALLALCGSNYLVYQTVINPDGTREPWRNLGGDCRGGGPGITRTSSGAVLISAVDSTGAVRIRVGPVDATVPWVSIGGVATSAVAVTPVSATSAMLVVRGSNARTYAQIINLTTGTGGGWIGLGGEIDAATPPSAVTTGADQRVLVFGTNGYWYEMIRSGDTFGGWHRI